MAAGSKGAGLGLSASGRRVAQAVALYRRVLVGYPNQPKVWMSLGHMLKTLGEQDESIAAYRRAIAMQPTLGEAWWSLANLKTIRFTEADRAAMRAALETPGLDGDDRFHLEFALVPSVVLHLLKNLLGKAALLTLMHKTSQAGRQYCAINAISKLPKGMTAPKESVSSQVFYEIENGQNEVFAALPEWLQDKVRASKEFSMATGKPTASKAELDADGNQVPF
jgi:tetratricopeptide (TPR) repeat protein